MGQAGPASLTEQELRERMRQVVHPGPVVHIGPAYPITTFKDFDNPYPGYYCGARVLLDPDLNNQVWVEETPLKS